ncbi:MAG: hypothetical protein JSR76_06405 [Verrucomicrobia bacterium]|nr:hypothetical protein [Verrucomicrobiota bacterium]
MEVQISLREASFLYRMQCLLAFLDRRGYYKLSRSIVSFCIEPKSFIKMLWQYPLGAFYKPFKLNYKAPITLFLHGNHHNPAAFHGLIRYLKKRGLASFFAVKLPSGEVTERDFLVVQEKLKAIRKAYADRGASFTYQIVGHSRGAEVGSLFLGDPELVKLICLGTPISTLCAPPEEEKLFEIDGHKDVLVLERSLARHRASFNLGHIGLLYSERVFSQVYRWLSNSFTSL